MPKSNKDKKEPSGKINQSKPPIAKKERVSKGSHPFEKFSPAEFDEWMKLPRSKMIEAIRVRNGIKNYKTKSPFAYLKRPKPVLITLRGREGYPGSYRFYLKPPGERARSLKIPVDIQPIPTLEYIKRNPRWWRKSKRRHDIDKATMPYVRKNMEDTLRTLMGQQSYVYQWLSETLLRGGFYASKMLKMLEEQIGKAYLVELCEKCFIYSDEQAKAYTMGFTLEEFSSLTDEQRALFRKGPLSIEG